MYTEPHGVERRAGKKRMANNQKEKFREYCLTFIFRQRLITIQATVANEGDNDVGGSPIWWVINASFLSAEC